MAERPGAFTHLKTTPVLPSPPASHTLPPEVVELIILAAIPPNSHELHAFPTRSSILLSLSLVSPTFRAIAQRELLRDVTLETTERATAFASQGDRRWDQVRVLRVGREVTNQSSWAFGLEAAGFVLSRLLSQCTRLEQLWLRQLRHVNLSGLYGKPGFRELYLFDVSLSSLFATHGASNQLPSLYRLYIVHCRLPSSTIPLFNSSTFPALRALAFDGNNVGTPDDPVGTLTPCPITSLDPSIFRHLLVLSIGNSIGKTFESAPSLQLVDTWSSLLTPSVVATLPASLRILRVCDDRMGDPEPSLPLVVSHLSALEGLRRVLVSDVWEKTAGYEPFRAAVGKGKLGVEYTKDSEESSGFDLALWELADELARDDGRDDRRGPDT